MRVTAPRGPLSSQRISLMVHERCERAGIPPVGAHRLRHSAATGMLAAGASLAEIAQVLRHSTTATTSIYARVDRDRLRAVARPWPGQSDDPATGSLGDYLLIRRQLGAQLKTSEPMLEQFVNFLEQNGAERIASELAVAWATLPVACTPGSLARPVWEWSAGSQSILATLDPASEIPSVDLLKATQPRLAPHIFSDQEITG